MGKMEEEGKLNELTHKSAKHAKGPTQALMSPHVIAFHAAQQFQILIRLENQVESACLR